MENKDEKQLWDRDGKPVTKERIEEVFGELFKPMKPLLEKCEWEEDGQKVHCWKINTPAGEGTRAITGYTNDAGAAQIHEAMKNEVQKWLDETNSVKKNTDNSEEKLSETKE